MSMVINENVAKFLVSWAPIIAIIITIFILFAQRKKVDKDKENVGKTNTEKSDLEIWISKKYLEMALQELRENIKTIEEKTNKIISFAEEKNYVELKEAANEIFSRLKNIADVASGIESQATTVDSYHQGSHGDSDGGSKGHHHDGGDYHDAGDHHDSGHYNGYGYYKNAILILIECLGVFLALVVNKKFENIIGIIWIYKFALFGVKRT